MKKLIILSGLLLFCVVSFAQHRGMQGDFEKFKSQKISFMTEKMELSPEEAQKFWPIYNEFEEKRMTIFKTRKELEDKVNDNYTKFSENEFKKLSYEIVDLHVKEAGLLKEYHEKFLRVLPAKKVVVIGQLENEFRFKMIREFRQRERENENKK